jgi:hypothetical protein
MMSYQYAVVRQRGPAIELQITDSSTINQLLDDMADSIAGFGASACKLPGGAPYYWRLYGLAEDLERAWAMIEEHFVSNGWSSLDETSASSQDASRTMCFGILQHTQSKELHREPVPCLSPA